MREKTDNIMVNNSVNKGLGKNKANHPVDIKGIWLQHAYSYPELLARIYCWILLFRLDWQGPGVLINRGGRS